jgi:hypothetical protein
MWSGEPGNITPSKSEIVTPNGKVSPSAMLSCVQRISGQCSRTASANSEKLDGSPNPARSACQTAGVPSAIRISSIRQVLERAAAL